MASMQRCVANCRSATPTGMRALALEVRRALRSAVEKAKGQSRRRNDVAPEETPLYRNRRSAPHARRLFPRP